MNHHQRSETVNNWTNRSDEPEGSEPLKEVKCGYCGDVQEDPEAMACNKCLQLIDLKFPMV